MTNENNDLLIEIGTEELPPKALQRLSSVFANEICQALDKAKLGYTASKHFATPRRLAILISGLQSAQQSQEVLRKGPALTAAFDDEGCPTRAALGFAKSCGVEVEQLEQQTEKKGTWLVYRNTEQGQATTALIPDIIKNALNKLPIPKRMRWADKKDEFVRPVHWVLILFGDEVINTNILGVQSGRETRGHRFHHPSSIRIDQPANYESILAQQAWVIADMDQRKKNILQQINAAANELKGTAHIDPDLLNEVTALVEWPIAIHGSFDKAFLEIPAEALISSMQDHQKYFPLLDQNGKLLPHFITIANIESKDPAQIQSGNERVIRPRLADAAFFWQQDKKQSLAQRVDALDNIVFQKKLGSIAAKQKRVAKLAQTIAGHIDANTEHAQRAAQLAKCDLLTDMVGEFPDLQGTMGRYYALEDGEDSAVANALNEQYMPRHAGGELPVSAIGQSLALADRIDTLIGIFSLGQAPTGDKDPFALRRAALGVLRIIIECELNLDLQSLLQQAADQLEPDLHSDQLVISVFDFMLERLRAYYAEKETRPDIFESVYLLKPTRPLDFNQRILACNEFIKLPEAETLAAANKRIRNILRKTNEAIPAQVNSDLLSEEAEQRLFAALEALYPQVTPMLEQGDYTRALTTLAELHDPVDQFFDQVMVMDKDDALRGNRLALLNQLAELFLQVSDISVLQSISD